MGSNFADSVVNCATPLLPADVQDLVQSPYERGLLYGLGDVGREPRAQRRLPTRRRGEAGQGDDGRGGEERFRAHPPQEYEAVLLRHPDV